MSRTMTVYTYNELSEEAKTHALEKFRASTTWQNWHDDDSTAEVTEHFEEALPEKGYIVRVTEERFTIQGYGGKPPRPGIRKRPHIYWSLGSCQGDGMCWEGTLDFDKLIPRFIEEGCFTQDEYEAIKPRLEDLDASISHSNSHYYHYNTMDLNWEERTPDPETAFEELVESHLVTIMEKLRGIDDADIRSVSQNLASEGEEIIEFRSSDESAKDALENANYEFDEDGDKI